MINKRFFFLLLLATCYFACSETIKQPQSKSFEIPPTPTNRVVLSTEIKWEKLNPARGDQSPQAGTIWGDRNGAQATGFLAKFVDGFSSPPHIHNVTYRAMVIKGLIHNDDPKAEKMWMPAGSFWTQPAGESHITAANGSECIAYVEIDSGPYLVKPITEAFDNGERPVNVDKNNIIWLDAVTTTHIRNKESTADVAIAFLWENGKMSGKLIRLPAGFTGEIVSTGEHFHAVVISGESNYLMPPRDEVKPLDPGSYFTSNGRSVHSIRTRQESETILYIRTDDVFHVR